jgi:hypothetical protein
MKGNRNIGIEGKELGLIAIAAALLFTDASIDSMGRSAQF